MANPYRLSMTKNITAPNGVKITIWTDGLKDYIVLAHLARALGYVKYTTDGSILHASLKTPEISCCLKAVKGIPKTTYVIDIKDVVNLLERFIRLTFNVTKGSIRIFQDNARMEAQRLIEVFNREVFGKPDTVTTKPIETPVANSKGDTKMEIFKPTNTPAQGTVPVVTVADIDDISARADATAKVFGVSKADALRAVTKLKAEEINRDLAPLLELLG